MVREAAKRLRGEVRVRTEAYGGTTVELDVPVSISSLHALIVEASNTVAAIPLDGVRHTLRVGSSNIVRTPHGETITHDGKVIPFIPLRRPPDARSKQSNARPAWTVVVIGHSDLLAGIGVDRIIGTSNIVLRPLPLSRQRSVSLLARSLMPTVVPRWWLPLRIWCSSLGGVASHRRRLKS